MKFSLVVCALAAGSAAAFAPATQSSTSTALNMERRDVFGSIGVAAAGLAFAPALALADGSTSKTTVQRSRGIYGDRIASLAGAVAKGDFAAVSEEKNAFILFNSGAYIGAKNKPKKAIAIEGTNAIFAAIRSQDKAALKSAYDSYIKANDITGFPDIDNNGGQGYSNDFDFKVKTKSAAIYQR
jgi:hypothetical protein|uniref:Photosystem II Psb31 protein domain-containing protein n=2 Tax=Sar TaxID=2698737 RepID=A0A7S2XWK6_9STRA|mmetsp:Transcript_7877/g.14191  ORF Transcript_7877/g.14191 Transcript_7877/m.14191 type:complete len:184 (+) Transcript_7877:138-689(+)|eukprot:CAMPEP_0198282464 /NCGR_PEP_ID=MMETSP1449-20131203/2272_1 /TAXON_ID=420275 /ORGANISM="Attheya septentrionalis, Strain CCMP2084" /LENGTH=183 /DNA_ID=CAMNT_0043978729 /DNA_START=37 /DNA_END=588 /DNA_ORIENTATION=-